MSKYKASPNTIFHIRLNELESSIYFLFLDFARNIKHGDGDVMLLDIVYKFMHFHLPSLEPKLFSKEGNEFRKTYLKAVSNKIL